MLDWLNKEIKEGSIVIYPCRQSSSIWMTKAIILKINEDGSLKVRAIKNTNSFYNNKKYETTLTATNRITVLE